MKAFLAVLMVFLLRAPMLAVAEDDARKPIFEDKFDSKLAEGWSWMYEEPKAWRIGSDGLEIRALRSWGRDRKNVLLTPPYKAGSELIAEVFVEIHPTVSNEHANLQCYFDEKNWVALNSESDVTMTTWKDGKAKFLAIGHRHDVLWLRLVVAGGKATGYFRLKPAEDWKKVGEVDLPAHGDFHFAVTAGGGGKGDTNDWARFRDFRILQVSK